jgi:hypothetical protein
MPRRQPNVDLFLSLDKLSKGPSGEMIRIRGLEWLRLESLRRADLTPQEKGTYRKELQDIRYHRHDCLIKPDRKNLQWVYPYAVPALKRAGAVEVVPPGMRGRDPRRLCLAVDPTQPQKVLIAAFKDILRSIKSTRRAPGAGRRYSLAQLWEALQLYDDWKAHDVSPKDLGFRIRTLTPLEERPDTLDSAIERGRTAVALAKRMIHTAQNSSAPWLKVFL